MLPLSVPAMEERKGELSTSLERPIIRSHSPYCEATGPIVKEGFVAARIRYLEEAQAHKGARISLQSYFPKVPCSVHRTPEIYEPCAQSLRPTLEGTSDSYVAEQPQTASPGICQRPQHSPESSSGLGRDETGKHRYQRSSESLNHSLLGYQKTDPEAHDASISVSIHGSLQQPRVHVSSPIPLLGTRDIASQDINRCSRDLSGQTTETPKRSRDERLSEKSDCAEDTLTERIEERSANSRISSISLHLSEPKDGLDISHEQPSHIVSCLMKYQQSDLTASRPVRYIRISPQGGLSASEGSPQQNERRSISQASQPGTLEAFQKIIDAGEDSNRGHAYCTRPLLPQKIRRAWTMPQAADSKMDYIDPSKLRSPSINFHHWSRGRTSSTQDFPSTLPKSNDLASHASPFVQPNSSQQSVLKASTRPARRPSGVSMTSSLASSTPSNQSWKKWRWWKLVPLDWPRDTRDHSQTRRSASTNIPSSTLPSILPSEPAAPSQPAAPLSPGSTRASSTFRVRHDSASGSATGFKARGRRRRIHGVQVNVSIDGSADLVVEAYLQRRAPRPER